MSAEHARKFVDLVDSDPQLQEEVKKNQGNLVALAAQKGFTVSPEELHAELRGRWGIDNPADDAIPGCQNEGDHRRHH